MNLPHPIKREPSKHALVLENVLTRKSDWGLKTEGQVIKRKTPQRKHSRAVIEDLNH
jgi:hypothetical protein